MTAFLSFLFLLLSSFNHLHKMICVRSGDSENFPFWMENSRKEGVGGGAGLQVCLFFDSKQSHCVFVGDESLLHQFTLPNLFVRRCDAAD